MAQLMDQSESPGPGTGLDRWRNLQLLLCRGSPLAHPDFEPSPDTLQFVHATCKIIVIGAGGLGCELLKDLALLGFSQIHCIDMDTIDLSNLNRQFLFRYDYSWTPQCCKGKNGSFIALSHDCRPSDIGKPKSIVAAEFVNKRISGCCVVPHYCKIQDYGPDFYQQFHLIVCGLDSITARRWINGMALSLLRYKDGELDQSSIIPVIDGGTEGFKGNARVILPGITACIDCTLDLYPPQVSYPLCTIASKPRLPEHCIEYVRVLLWSKEKPFGGASIDGDNPDHMLWIHEKAQERAEEYGIQGVTYRLTKGVVKNIIPAVASTNAVIAAACATEAFKLATSCSRPLQNYMVFNDTDGVYTYTFEYERKEDCFSCSTRPVSVAFSSDAKLKELYDHLIENQAFLMKSPSLTTVVNGNNKTLYMPTLEAMKRVTEANLSKTFQELGIEDGHEIVVADMTTPKPVTLSIKYIYNME